MAENDTIADEGSPFTRPRFVFAAVVVLIIALLGAIVAVRVARSNTDAGATPTASELPASSPTSPPNGESSVCGLEGGTQDPPVVGPVATWKYQGTVAYPESPELGPGMTAPDGYRYCFQHSASGALLMAANAVAQGSDPVASSIWLRYALSRGPHREALLAQGGSTGSEGVRLKIAGFRVLQADAVTARVDVATTGSAQGQDVAVSAVYELVWQDGDWKISADVERPIDVGVIPNLTGYTPWGE